MFTIKKYPAPLMGENVITVPNMYGVLTAEVIDNVPHVWLVVDLDTPLRPAYFYIYEENDLVVTTQFMGSGVVVDENNVSKTILVFHKYVYWENPDDPEDPMGDLEAEGNAIEGETTNIVIE